MAAVRMRRSFAPVDRLAKRSAKLISPSSSVAEERG
jgi:hypothetical protein